MEEDAVGLLLTHGSSDDGWAHHKDENRRNSVEYIQLDRGDELLVLQLISMG